MLKMLNDNLTLHAVSSSTVKCMHVETSGDKVWHTKALIATQAALLHIRHLAALGEKTYMGCGLTTS